MSYWNAGSARGPINDEFVLAVIHHHQKWDVQLTKALIDDDLQSPEGGVWAHIEDMEKRGLVKITNGVVTT